MTSRRRVLDSGALMHSRRTGHLAAVDGLGVWHCVNCPETGSMFAQEEDLKKTLRERVLNLLSNVTSGISTVDLSEMLMSPQSVISRVLSTLAREGLVEKTPATHDRRIRHYQITEKGRSALKHPLMKHCPTCTCTESKVG